MSGGAGRRRAGWPKPGPAPVPRPPRTHSRQAVEAPVAGTIALFVSLACIIYVLVCVKGGAVLAWLVSVCGSVYRSCSEFVYVRLCVCLPILVVVNLLVSFLM